MSDRGESGRPIEPWREQGVRRARAIVIGSTTPGVVIIWALWVAYHFFQVDLFGWDRSDHPTPRGQATWTFFGLAALGTAAATTFGWLLYRHHAGLYRNGVGVYGRVVKRLFKGGGMVRLKVGYAFGGRDFVKAMPVPSVLADEYERGRPVRLLVDPTRPRRAIVVGDR